MSSHRNVGWGGICIFGFGFLLLCIAVTHHWREMAAIDESVGPVVALLIDGPPALGLMYAGYHLAESGLEDTHVARIARWCIVGIVTASILIGISMSIRLVEGRTLSEPVFTLLLAAEIGATAGLVAGYYRAQSRIARKEAEEKADALAFVNSVIRHDLKNDLRIIAGQTDLMEAEYEPESEALSSRLAVVSETVSEASNRLEETEVIAETLQETAELEPVDLTEYVTDVATRFEETTAVRLKTDLSEQAVVPANRGLRSVIDNLLENAVDHNDTDDPMVEASINVTDDKVRFAVRDNGPGIPAEQRTTLFESSGGTGKGGLQIVQGLVDSYDGTIWVEDNEPRGSVIVVELPQAGAATVAQ